MRQNTAPYGESASPTTTRRSVHPQSAHTSSVGTLLVLLVRDPTVQATFGEFEVADTAYRLGELGERLAQRAGLPGRAALLELSVTVWQTPEYQALNDTYTRQVQAALPELETRLKALVFDVWQLEWPWLVYELREHYVGLLTSLITGDNWTGSFGTTLPPPPPPNSGESRDAYFRRLRGFYATPYERRGVRVNPARIERDVRIFYRRRLKQPSDSVHAIAKSEGRLSPYQTRLADRRAFKLLSEPLPRLMRSDDH